ncbi:MAG: amidohydrolase family protein, partial [Marinicella sp.]
MKNICLSMLLAYSFAANSAEPKTVTYDWLTLGKKSGELNVTYLAGGLQTAEFEFNDRGRGPKISESIRLDDHGQVISYKVTGNSYMGSDVDESYRLNQGEAQWQSTDEQGRDTVTGPVAYVNSQGTTESLGVMVRYVMQQPNNKLELLPSGQASVEELISTTVKHEDQEKSVKLMALSGLGFTPSYLWLDESNQIFAVAYGWMGMTPAGWGAVLPELQELQDQAEKTFQQNLAQKLTEKLPVSLLIKNVNIVDVKAGTLLNDSAVYLESGIIKAMGEEAKKLTAKSVIDGHGKTLMPGLWDMHVHAGLSDGLLHLAAGVTNVRDMANTHDDLLKTIEAFDHGVVMGPHVYKAGFIDQKSPFSAPTGKLAETLDQALEFVDWYAERGYPQIKIYSSITPSWVKPIADRIHHHGMKLSGHIPSFMKTEQAVKDGYDEIQHINMLFLNFLADDKDDTRTPVRFTLVGEEAGALDLESKEVADFIQLLKEKSIVVDPTVTIFHSMFLNKSGEIDPGYAAIADHLPTNVRRGFLGSELKITAENELKYQKSAAALLVMIKKLHEAGIQLVAGTDAIVGFTLHRELELYAQAGISHADVLKIATIDSAK